MFFISDTHFFHERIIELAKRPFNSVHEMNEEMIARWNSVVSEKSIVYHLGDFAFGTWKTRENLSSVFHRLNGQKHLIVGNHDHSETLELPWSSVSKYAEIKHNKRMVVLQHYPILEWNKCFNNSMHFHGHTHNESPLKVLRTFKRGETYAKNWRNLCVEMNDYRPRHIDDLMRN